MDIKIEELGKNLDKIPHVQEFLFKMIKKEFGFDYIQNGIRTL